MLKLKIFREQTKYYLEPSQSPLFLLLKIWEIYPELNLYVSMTPLLATFVMVDLKVDGVDGGYVIFLEGPNGNCSPLIWQSKTLRRVVRSTMAAETLSPVEAEEACFWLSGMLKEVLLNHQDRSPQYSIECRTDSHHLYDAVNSIRPVLDKRLRINIAILKEMLERKELSQIKRIDKNCELADSLTKRGASSHNLMRVFAEGKLQN